MDAKHPIAFDQHACMDWLWAFANQTHEYAILILDRAGAIRWANPGAGFVLGADPPDIVGQPVRRFFTEDDAAIGIPELELQLATVRGSAPDDRWMRRADGSRFWATGVTLAPVPEGGLPPGFLKIFRDHTERKMLIESTRNRLDRCARESEERRKAIAVIAHELRGPLSAISLAGEIMALVDAEAPQFRTALQGAQRNVGFAVRMVEDLEEHARAEAGKLSLERAPVVLAPLLEAAIAIASHREAARRIDLLVPAAGIEIEADPLRLQQVFVNLVGNAIRFTPEPGRIWVAATLEEDEAVVRISDQGIGIAPDMLDRIFEMFTQAETTNRTPGLGVGLGLAKTIVELHGGSVQARSEGVGKGSEFTVRLPLRRRAPWHGNGLLRTPTPPTPEGPPATAA